MIRRTFVWGKDEEFGDNGWMPDWIEGANVVLEGFAAAHDVLEHFPVSKHVPNGFEGEMMAFGSILCGRGNHGWFSNNYNPSVAQNMASDIMSFWRNGVLYGEQSCRPCPYKVRIDPEDSHSIEEAVRLAIGLFLSEEQFDGGRKEMNERMPTNFRQNTINWMRYGVRKFWDRCNRARISSGEFMGLFYALESEFKRVTGASDWRSFNNFRRSVREFDLGTKLHVRVCLKRQDVRVWTSEPWEDANEYA